ncbi:MAG: hypothetical protein ACR2GY_00590 [Phycisphaerales bacterium]
MSTIPMLLPVLLVVCSSMFQVDDTRPAAHEPLIHAWERAAEHDLAPGVYTWSSIHIRPVSWGLVHDARFDYRFWYWDDAHWRVSMDYGPPGHSRWLDYAGQRENSWKLSGHWLVLMDANDEPSGHSARSSLRHAKHRASFMITRGMLGCAQEGWRPAAVSPYAESGVLLLVDARGDEQVLFLDGDARVHEMVGIGERWNASDVERRWTFDASTPGHAEWCRVYDSRNRLIKTFTSFSFAPLPNDFSILNEPMPGASDTVRGRTQLTSISNFRIWPPESTTFDAAGNSHDECGTRRRAASAPEVGSADDWILYPTIRVSVYVGDRRIVQTTKVKRSTQMYKRLSAILVIVALIPTTAFAVQECYTVSNSYSCCSSVSTFQPIWCFGVECESEAIEDHNVTHAIPAEAGFKIESLGTGAKPCRFKRAKCTTEPSNPCTVEDQEELVYCVHEWLTPSSFPDCP